MRPWEDADSPVSGSSTWSIIECMGCKEISAMHSEWFSEDVEQNSDGSWSAITNISIYPPTPNRKIPEWGFHFLILISTNDLWMIKLHKDIYAAIGLEAYSLAAMGTRTLIDSIMTSKVGDAKGDNFKTKLDRMVSGHFISKSLSDILHICIESGNAAAHRGHSPTVQELNTLLDNTEALIEHIYIEPFRQKERERAAAELKEKTPERFNRPPLP